MSSIWPAALLVDMDGTLVDTEPLWFQVESAVMATLGGTWGPEDQEHCVGIAMEMACAYMIERSGADAEVPQVLAACIEAMVGLLETVPLTFMPGIVDLLTEAHQAGVPIALVSASHRRLVDPVLNRLDQLLARQVFAVSVAGDEVANSKPHPEPYLAATRALGVRPHTCVVLEDSRHGVMSGMASGAFVVGIPNVVALEPAHGLMVARSASELNLELLAAEVRSHAAQRRE